MICGKRKISLSFLLAILLSFLFLAGCKEEEHMTATVEERPLSEREIIESVKNYVLQNFQDEVEVEILGKSDLTHTTYIGPGIDGPSIFNRRFVRVKNGHAYKVNVFNAKYNVSVEGVYNDGFSIYDEETGNTEIFEREIILDERYQTMKDEVDLMVDFNDILSEYFTKFHVYKDASNYNHECGYYNVYLYGTDEAKMAEACERLVAISCDKYPCVYEFRAFVFTDEQLYDSVDFDECNNIDFVRTGENPEEETDRLTELELHYEPEKLLERYWGVSMKYVECCVNLDHEFFVTRGYSEFLKEKAKGRQGNRDFTEEEINAFSQVLYICIGSPQMYENGKESKKVDLRWGTTKAFVFDLPE